jgi:hypothetical protein
MLSNSGYEVAQNIVKENNMSEWDALLSKKEAQGEQRQRRWNIIGSER